ncbi:MAG: carbonic anhydrase family protein [Geminicoccaceae bacterium]|nr:carbonic anhydrase family protein [Geminicoccaceae bacterium]
MWVRRSSGVGAILVLLSACSTNMMPMFGQGSQQQPMTYDMYGQPPAPVRRMSIADPPAPVMQPPAASYQSDRIFASADRIDVGPDPYRYSAGGQEPGKRSEPMQLTGLDSHGVPPKHEAPSSHGASKGGGGGHWSYSGPDGPEHWGDLSPDYKACATGKAQSPIDLASARRGVHEDLQFHYGRVPLQIRNNGHTLQIDYAPGSWLDIEGMRYELLQFHIHAPSEHVVDGRSAPMEVHLVHQNRHGQLAVVGVMIDAGPMNPVLAAMEAYKPPEGPPAVVPGVFVNAADLLPPRHDYFRYTGSLTTPPCSEGVAWHVLDQPMTTSLDNLRDLAAAMPPHNARPAQALNGRRVTLD